jgi:hypothetical protein
MTIKTAIKNLQKHLEYMEGDETKIIAPTTLKTSIKTVVKDYLTTQKTKR